MKVAVCLAGGTLLIAGAAWAAVEGMTARTAGDVTVFADGRNAFSFPAANLPDEERTRLQLAIRFSNATGCRPRHRPLRVTDWARISLHVPAVVAMCRTAEDSRPKFWIA